MTRCAWILCLATIAQAQTGYLTYPTGIAPNGVAAADLNGDGRPDLVVANSGSNFLSILINNGTGGFTPLAPISFANLAPYQILATDLNGDHKTDLIVTSATPLTQNGSSIGLVVMLGNGDGSFQTPLPVSGCSQVTDMQVGDLNGDGIPDLSVTCLSGGFLVPVFAYALVLPGNGDGTFATGAQFDLGFTPWAVLAIGDFNRDGQPDIAIATGSGLSVYLNDGKANFTTVNTPGEPWNFAPGITAGDFNGDGLVDLAVSAQSFDNLSQGTVSILLGQGDGTFRLASTLQTTGFGLLKAQDLNGDGHLDLVEGLSTLTFFPGRGDGTFGKAFSFSVPADTGFFALADFTASGVQGFGATNRFVAPDGTLTSEYVVILPRAVWPTPALANVSAAGYGLGLMAPGSIATAFGSNLAMQTAQASEALPLSLAGAAVSVTDSAGTTRHAPLYYVSPGQVNYVVPPDTAPGLATMSITASGQVTASGPIQIAPVAPALFVVNTDYLAAANVVKVSQNGDATFESIYRTDQNGNVTALPIDLGIETDLVYLILYGTGIRNNVALSAVTAIIEGGPSLPVTYAGPQGTYEGFDQVNILLPHALASSSPRQVGVELTVAGQPSNLVTLLVQ